jgi:isopenicillin N synthase-like dioxygenase
LGRTTPRCVPDVIDFFRYKPVAYNVVDPQGTPDRNETLNISKDELLHQRIMPYSELGVFNEKTAESMRTFTFSSHSILVKILQILSQHFALNGDNYLPNLHAMEKVSEDHLRLVKYSYSQPGDIMLERHTDFGSLTLLITHERGLQILDETTKAWLWVEPKQGAAIINIGDALVKFTNGILHSVQHRVVNPNNVPEGAVKYSLGYFMRPDSGVLLRALDSEFIPKPEEEEEEMTSKEWQDYRVAVSRIGNFNKETDWVHLKGTASSWD